MKYPACWVLAASFLLPMAASAQALGEVVGVCQEQARKLGRQCGFAGMSISGTVGYGIIFSFDGIPDWRPCTPTDLLREFEHFERTRIWTCIQCKITGFVHSLGRGNSIGYFEWDGSRLRMASMRDGTVIDGEIIPWEGDNPLPFAQLQRRIGRKKLGPKILAEVPVVLVAYDLLEEGGEDLRGGRRDGIELRWCDVVEERAPNGGDVAGRGGALRVESSPGGGTRVEATLPLEGFIGG